MSPILLIGDFTLDLIFNNGSFLPVAGGSVFNVASILRKYDTDVCFVSRVGNDLPGNFLLNQLEKLGISQNTIYKDEDFRTSVAFSEYDKSGKPHYSFYKEKKDFILPDETILNKDFSLFHIGSSFAFSQTSFPVVMKLCNLMQERRIPITYDINLRKIPSESEKKRIFDLMNKAQIIKGSDEDFNFLYGTSDKIAIRNKILSDYNINLGIITYGKDGAFLFSRSDSCFVKQNKILENVKSIGAGDSFMAGIILFCMKDFSVVNLDELGRFANSVAIDFLSSNGSI